MLVTQPEDKVAFHADVYYVPQLESKCVTRT